MPYDSPYPAGHGAEQYDKKPIYGVQVWLGGKLLRAAVSACRDKFEAVTVTEARYGVSKLYNGRPTNGVDRTKSVYLLNEVLAETCPLVVIGSR